MMAMIPLTGSQSQCQPDGRSRRLQPAASVISPGRGLPVRSLMLRHRTNLKLNLIMIKFKLTQNHGYVSHSGLSAATVKVTGSHGHGG